MPILSRTRSEPDAVNFPVEVILSLENGRFTDAIKTLRTARGIGLKEAKDIVELYLANHPRLRERCDVARKHGGRKALIWIVATLFACAVIYLTLGVRALAGA